MQRRQLFQRVRAVVSPRRQGCSFQAQRRVPFLGGGVLGSCLLVRRLRVCNLLLQLLLTLGQSRQLFRQFPLPLGRSSLSLVCRCLFPAALLQLLSGIVSHQLPLAHLALQTKDLILCRSQLGFRLGQLIVRLT